MNKKYIFFISSFCLSSVYLVAMDTKMKDLLSLKRNEQWKNTQEEKNQLASALITTIHKNPEAYPWATTEIKADMKKDPVYALAVSWANTDLNNGNFKSPGKPNLFYQNGTMGSSSHRAHRRYQRPPHHGFYYNGSYIVQTNEEKTQSTPQKHGSQKNNTDALQASYELTFAAGTLDRGKIIHCFARGADQNFIREEEKNVLSLFSSYQQPEKPQNVIPFQGKSPFDIAFDTLQSSIKQTFITVDDHFLYEGGLTLPTYKIVSAYNTYRTSTRGESISKHAAYLTYKQKFETYNDRLKERKNERHTNAMRNAISKLQAFGEFLNQPDAPVNQAVIHTLTNYKNEFEKRRYIKVAQRVDQLIAQATKVQKDLPAVNTCIEKNVNN